MTLSDQEEAVLDNLEMLVRLGRTVDEAAEQLRRMKIADGLIDRVLEFRREVVTAGREQALEGGALLDPEEVGSPWYLGTTGNDVFWPKLEKTLRADPSWTDAVESLDRASHHIVG